MIYLSWTSFVSNLAKLCQQIIQIFFWATFTYPYLTNKLNVWHIHILYPYESHVLFSLKTILWHPPLLSFQASFVTRDSHVTQFQSIRYKQKSNRSFWRSFHSSSKEGSYSWHYPFPLLSALTFSMISRVGATNLTPKKKKEQRKGYETLRDANPDNTGPMNQEQLPSTSKFLMWEKLSFVQTTVHLIFFCLQLTIFLADTVP